MNKIMNTVVFALSEDNAREAIVRLQQEGYIHIVEWFGVDKGHGVITHDYGTLRNVDVLREYYRICPKAIYDKVYQRLYTYLDMSYRADDSPLYELVNGFNLLVGYYYGLFSLKNVELLFFGDVPHFGVDSIAKDVADAMGIRTLLFDQMYQANRFFAFTDINDIGIYASVPNNGCSDVVLDGKVEKNLLLLTKEDRYGAEKHSSSILQLISKVLKNWNQLPKKINEKIIASGKTVYRRNEEEKYLKNMEKAAGKGEINLDVDYVYFPLHLQPEMTTSAFGKEFCDQILAIERVSEMIPPTWRIYVKEYPIQSAYMRGDLFFKRLELLPKVQFIGGENNTYSSTYDLIKHSRFVATITGTAGWEAISGEKPALVFGLAWYRKLPGVFEYANNPKLEDILQCKINYKEVEAAYNCLMEKAYDGILECGWESQVEDYSPAKNNALLFSAFVRMIELIQKQEYKK